MIGGFMPAESRGIQRLEHRIDWLPGVARRADLGNLVVPGSVPTGHQLLIRRHSISA
jgi:hypothetical protein